MGGFLGAGIALILLGTLFVAKRKTLLRLNASASNKYLRGPNVPPREVEPKNNLVRPAGIAAIITGVACLIVAFFMAR
jgi:hypothetical protein